LKFSMFPTISFTSVLRYFSWRLFATWPFPAYPWYVSWYAHHSSWSGAS
jgi:hypothetical protein